MSMFKVPLNIPSNNVVTNNLRNFVTEDQLNNINKIPDIQSSIVTLENTSAKKISLINEKILINNGIITLAYKPLSALLINNMIMVVEDLTEGILLHAELINEFTIADVTVELGSNFYNGYYAMVSYIHEGI